MTNKQCHEIRLNIHIYCKQCHNTSTQCIRCISLHRLENFILYFTLCNNAYILTRNFICRIEYTAYTTNCCTVDEKPLRLLPMPTNFWPYDLILRPFGLKFRCLKVLMCTTPNTMTLLFNLSFHFWCRKSESTAVSKQHSLTTYLVSRFTIWDNVCSLSRVDA